MSVNERFEKRAMAFFPLLRKEKTPSGRPCSATRISLSLRLIPFFSIGGVVQLPGNFIVSTRVCKHKSSCADCFTNSGSVVGP